MELGSDGPRVEDGFTSSPFHPQRRAPRSLGEVDLSDRSLYAEGDPHYNWKLLREEAPVFWHPPGRGYHGPFWVLPCYEEASFVYKSPELFSSSEGDVLGAEEEVGPLGPSRRLKSLFNTDAPFHTKLRRITQGWFTRSSVKKHAKKIEECTRKSLGSLGGVGEGDFVDVADAAVKCGAGHVLGLSGDEMEAVGTRDTTESLSAWQSVLERRRAVPGDDPVSAVATAELDGEQLDDVTASVYCSVMLGGATDSSRHLLSNSLLTLIHHPEQWRMLRDSSGLIEGATEELLRWISVGLQNKRVVTRDVMVRGQRILAGDVVVVSALSGNRDEAVFADPFSFDVRRDARRHLAFGMGPHFCLGAQLARMQLQSMLRVLVEHVKEISLAGRVIRERHPVSPAIGRLPVHVVEA